MIKEQLMTKVKIKVHTGWGGLKRSPGDVINVSDFLAARWAKFGISDTMPVPVIIPKPATEKPYKYYKGGKDDKKVK